jgi:hypothetical protein
MAAKEEDRHLDKERHAERIRLANEARYAARRRFEKLHPEDWEQLLAEEYEARGLTLIGANRRTDPEREVQAETQAREAEQRRRERDLTGKVFERWTVLQRGPNSTPTEATPNGQTRWLCQCACGTLKLVLGRSLRSGQSRSCGCLQRELTRARAGPQPEAAADRV